MAGLCRNYAGFWVTWGFFYGLFYGRAKFCCKSAQFCATRCKYGIAEIPSVRNAVRRCENERKKSFSNYESPAVTAELQAPSEEINRHAEKEFTEYKYVRRSQLLNQNKWSDNFSNHDGEILRSILNGSRMRRRTLLHLRFIVSSGTRNRRIKRSGKERGRTMHPFIQFKKATPLIFIAGTIIFVGGIVPPTSSEGINLDAIGNDVVTTPRATVADFNNDGHPDYVLRNASTHQTAIWYLNNNVYVSAAFGPTLVIGWALDGVADFNRDSHADYALFNPATDQTALWYMSGPVRIATAYGPTLPAGWELDAAADFNGDGFPDYVLFNATSRRTAIWYLNNNVHVGGAFGPTLPVGWSLVGVADFDGDGHTDYVLFNSGNHQSAIWYLSGPTWLRGAYGPTVPSNWALVATADFNSDGHPDYLLYNPITRHTAIWYLNNNVYVSAAFGPTLPAGWSLVGQ